MAGDTNKFYPDVPARKMIELIRKVAKIGLPRLSSVTGIVGLYGNSTYGTPGSSADEKVAVDDVATPGYLGATGADGVLRVGPSITYTDGGDFVTLDVIAAAGTDNCFTVSPDGNAMYTTIAAAIADVVAPATDNRYCILVYPGRYNEQVVLPIFTSLVGVCDCPRAVEIYSATGPVIIFPNDATNEACLANVWVAHRPTLAAAEAIVISNGRVLVHNCYVEWTSSTNGLALAAIRQMTGICTYRNNEISYAAGGTAVGARAHYGFYLANGQAHIQDNIIGMTVNDVDDDAYGIHEDIAGTITTHIRGNRIGVNLVNVAATGNAVAYNGSGAGTTKIVQGNRIVLTVPVSANGFGIYCASLAGASVIESEGNIWRAIAAGACLVSSVAAGDVIRHSFDQVDGYAAPAGDAAIFYNDPQAGWQFRRNDISPSAVADNAGSVQVYHNPAAPSKKRMLLLQNINGDNDADGICLKAGIVEVFHTGWQGWLADKYYNQVATIVPAPPGTADSAAIVFGAALPSANYTVMLTGRKVKGIAAGPNVYNIESRPTEDTNVARAAAGFTADISWTVYNAATNAWVGSWDNYNAMTAALIGLPMTPALWNFNWSIRMWL